MQAHKERGIGYVAAPMFGRPDAAASAKLNIVTAVQAGMPFGVKQVLANKVLLEAINWFTSYLTVSVVFIPSPK